MGTLLASRASRVGGGPMGPCSIGSAEEARANFCRQLLGHGASSLSHTASHQQEMENGRKELLSLSPPNLRKKESDVLFLPVLNTNCENMLVIVYIVHIFHPTSLVFSLPRSSERVMMTFVIPPSLLKLENTDLALHDGIRTQSGTQ